MVSGLRKPLESIVDQRTCWNAGRRPIDHRVRFFHVYSAFRMSRRDEILRLLAQSEVGLDDDDIARRLQISRQLVNSICRELSRGGEIARHTGPTGKLMNLIQAERGAHEPSSIAASHTVVRRRRATARLERSRRNVEDLINGFSGFVDTFEKSGAFPGPSLYFHQKALQQRLMHSDVGSLLADDRFLEYIYAVLPAWGMHRMGKQSAKVGSFEAMAGSFRSCASAIESLSTSRITDLESAEASTVASSVWEVIASLQVSTSGTRIVAGSKALHHVLPNLVPPIDRQYTFRFFTGQMNVTTGDKNAFLEWFPYFCQIGRDCKEVIAVKIERGGFMATGPAKVIDNAIMGFMQGGHGIREDEPSST